MDIDRTHAFADQTPSLHRWFVARGVDACTADDLVQLTLIEGWRNLHKLESADGMRPWLITIAGFVLKRWWRSTVRETHAVLSQYPDVAGGIADDRLPEPSSGVEHEELATIVARAMERIPETDRQLLHARYDEERSVADLADGAGITAAHMAVRLQRVRARVRAALVDSGVPGLDAYGFDPLTIGWKPTPLWCPMGCAARLSMRINPEVGLFALKCPCCNSEDGHYLTLWESPGNRSVLSSIRSAPQAITKTAETGLWTVPLLGHERHCPQCHSPVEIRIHLTATGETELDSHQLHLSCPSCGPLQEQFYLPRPRHLPPARARVLARAPKGANHPTGSGHLRSAGSRAVDLGNPASSDRLTFIFDTRGKRLLAAFPNA